MAQGKRSRTTSAERCRHRLRRAEQRLREKKWRRTVWLERRLRQAPLKEEVVEDRLDHHAWEIDEGACGDSEASAWAEAEEHNEAQPQIIIWRNAAAMRVYQIDFVH